MINNILLVFLVILSCNHTGYASRESYTPKLGSVERQKIISALKQSFVANLKKPIKLRFSSLKIQNGWSFARGDILDKFGNPMNYQGTPYQDAIEAGIFDDWFCALLHKENGQWHIVNYSIGATDIPYLDWSDNHKAPQNIFK